MKLDLIRMVYAYSSWANNRILETAANLTDEQFSASVGASFPSVHETLVHTLGAQRLWLQRFQKQAPTSFLRINDLPDLASLQATWQEADREMQAFLDGLDEAALAEVIHYRNSAGEEFANPLWQTMSHQANHAMQHRSEVAVMLTQFGHSPGGLDMILFINTVAKPD